MLKLESRFVNRLAAQPESGMGWQRVEVTEWGVRREGIVYNAELFLRESEVREHLTRSQYEALEKAAASSAGRITDVRVIATPRVESRVMEKAGESKAPPEAENAPLTLTSVDEVFKRFSAYANDNRVRADGSFSPGTYATTEADARHVRTGSEAVERYSLPNPDPASWVFTSQPRANTKIQRGTVAPKFGHTGGGVEVIFPEGTQPHTTTGPTRIPD